MKLIKIRLKETASEKSEQFPENPKVPEIMIIIYE